MVIDFVCDESGSTDTIYAIILLLIVCIIIIFRKRIGLFWKLVTQETAAPNGISAFEYI